MRPFLEIEGFSSSHATAMLAMVMDLGRGSGRRLRPVMVVRDACPRNTRADVAVVRVYPAAPNADAEPLAGWVSDPAPLSRRHQRHIPAGDVSGRQRPDLL